MKNLRIHPNDNVAVVIQSGSPDFGHKIALSDICEGADVIKYGNPIGQASAFIKAGEKVHVHNIKTGLDKEFTYTYNPLNIKHEPRESGSFMGFRRADGQIAIRNEIWIIPTNGCVNGTAELIAKKAQERLYGSVSGVYAFPHPLGCSQLGDDHENTKKALCGLMKHPNAGGVLLLGLGCENNTIDGMCEMLGDIDRERMKFLVCQEFDDEITAALGLVEELIKTAAADVRVPVPVSELIVGLKCGGSDGLSGITANPLVGAFSDRLIAEGGSAILTEVPEMFGAEQILMDRCINVDIFNKTVGMINGFKEYYTRNGLPVYENPSPGNKDGGISTLEDKSLGCTQKAGTATVVDVLAYGSPVVLKGLNLLESPGNDLVAATALAASGAHIVLFTTGRGTPFGAPVPTVKISSNTPLYDKKRNWMDFNAGGLVSGVEMDGLLEEFYEYIIKLVSGEILTKAEQHGIRDIAIFKNGVTL